MLNWSRLEPETSRSVQTWPQKIPSNCTCR